MADNRIDPSQRRRRIAAGSLSAVPIAILVSFLYEKVFKEKLNQDVSIAIASVLGSLGTMFTLCFHDLRSLICGYLIRKRLVRNRRNTDAKGN